ncbi:hypothetical protein K1719_023306 [Acacia pycnantha]|nr:hypothetical protein K1719_023306 [Acacia pycnantha]
MKKLFGQCFPFIFPVSFSHHTPPPLSSVPNKWPARGNQCSDSKHCPESRGQLASLKLAAQRKSNTLRRNRSSTIRAEYRHLIHIRRNRSSTIRVKYYAKSLLNLPGIMTDEIDEAVHQMIIDNGAYPSPLGYGDFPKSVCTSVNECICHGIPDSRPLEDGDIINIDVTVYLNVRFYIDVTVYIPGISDSSPRFLMSESRRTLPEREVIDSRR